MFTFSVMSLRNNIKYNDKDVTIAEKEVFNNLTTAARMYTGPCIQILKALVFLKLLKLRWFQIIFAQSHSMSDIWHLQTIVK